MFTHERLQIFACAEQITHVTSGAVAVADPEHSPMSDRAAIRFRVMRALAQNPNMSQRDLARELGVSLGGINFCVNALIAKGAVKVENLRAADNKMRYAYILTPSGLSEKARMTGRFLQRKMDEYEALKAEIESLRGDFGDAPGDDEGRR